MAAAKPRPVEKTVGDEVGAAGKDADSKTDVDDGTDDKRVPESAKDDGTDLAKVKNKKADKGQK